MGIGEPVDGCPGVVGNLLEDVLQRGWERHAVRHGETESVGLSFAVIGVLSDDYHFEFVERAFVEGTKNVASSGEYPAGSVFLPYEVGEFSEIGFFELFGKNLFPVRSDFNIHGWY